MLIYFEILTFLVKHLFFLGTWIGIKIKMQNIGISRSLEISGIIFNWYSIFVRGCFGARCIFMNISLMCLI